MPVAAWISCAAILYATSRFDDRALDHAFDVQFACDLKSGCLAPLYRITDVREMTRSAPSWASVVMSASVIPSENSLLPVPANRFSSGRTARERIRARVPLGLSVESKDACVSAPTVERLERRMEFAGMAIAGRRLLGQAALDHRLQTSGNSWRQRRRRVAQNGFAQGKGRRAAERQTARNHFVEHDAKRPDVAARARMFPAQLFGGHVRQRARQRPNMGGVRLCRGVGYVLTNDTCGQPWIVQIFG